MLDGLAVLPNQLFDEGMAHLRTLPAEALTLTPRDRNLPLGDVGRRDGIHSPYNTFPTICDIFTRQPSMAMLGPKMFVNRVTAGFDSWLDTLTRHCGQWSSVPEG
ncbi:hypothetical protein DPMN_107667 [Dreissena polymorpha]|uniref:Uncharacterized protein n=1 Tax=Dreissena polymorpha TaxID=45954 RepID=A0A9D4QKE0_DREPO|nr:hypothetical protein DPMN_107667 [Dreissena polymorpha]